MPEQHFTQIALNSIHLAPEHKQIYNTHKHTHTHNNNTSSSDAGNFSVLFLLGTEYLDRVYGEMTK